MLNPEIAQARLKEYQVDNWQAIRIDRLLKLSPPLRSIGCGIFAHDDNGIQVKSEATYQLIENSIKSLGELKVGDRLQIFETIFPQFGSVVEATW